MSDKKYWETFYSNKKGILAPSPFALFLMDKYSLQGKLVELGCGNGRDSLFFAQKNIDVLGIDQCHNVVSDLNNLDVNNAKFKDFDFTNLGDLGTFDVVYSRFTLHSVRKEQATSVINWAYDSLNKDGRFCIEVRSIHDDFCGKGEEVEKDAFVSDHYRRFVRLNELVDELQEIGFGIDFQLESTGLAVYKDEDPSVIRIIASK